MSCGSPIEVRLAHGDLAGALPPPDLWPLLATGGAGLREARPVRPPRSRRPGRAAAELELAVAGAARPGRMTPLDPADQVLIGEEGDRWLACMPWDRSTFG